MEEEVKSLQSNAVAITKYFGINGKDAITMFKELTLEDKQALGDGIRNGTLTY